MNEALQSTILWASLVVVIAAAAFGIDRIFRALANRRAAEADYYPHRVANELPRTLHKGDHDEVIELKDETEVAA